MWETMLEDVEGMTMVEVTLCFVGVCWEMGWGHGMILKAQQHLRTAQISQHCLKGVMGCNSILKLGSPREWGLQGHCDMDWALQAH